MNAQDKKELHQIVKEEVFILEQALTIIVQQIKDLKEQIISSIDKNCLSH